MVWVLAGLAATVSSVGPGKRKAPGFSVSAARDLGAGWGLESTMMTHLG
jgi:hypothetical protein